MEYFFSRFSLKCSFFPHFLKKLSYINSPYGKTSCGCSWCILRSVSCTNISPTCIHCISYCTYLYTEYSSPLTDSPPTIPEKKQWNIEKTFFPHNHNSTLEWGMVWHSEHTFLWKGIIIFFLINLAILFVCALRWSLSCMFYHIRFKRW